MLEKGKVSSRQDTFFPFGGGIHGGPDSPPLRQRLQGEMADLHSRAGYGLRLLTSLVIMKCRDFG